MPLTTRTGLVVAALAATLTATLGLAPTAQAGGGSDNTQVRTGVPSKKVGKCRMYANESRFGMVCRKYKGGDRSVGEILQGDKVPECWDEPLPEDLVDEYAPYAADLEANGHKGRFVLRNCMKGIDPETLEITGEVEFTEEVRWLEEGDPGLPDLTANQRELVAIEGGQGTIPLPTLMTTPTVRPRVGQQVAFSLADGEPAVTPVVHPAAASVTMRARMTQLRVTPETGSRRVTCPNGGIQVAVGDTPTSLPAACWWRYTHSSSTQPEGLYPVLAEARWVVEYAANAETGPWQQFAVFTKEQTTMQTVTEVQTVAIR